MQRIRIAALTTTVLTILIVGLCISGVVAQAQTQTQPGSFYSTEVHKVIYPNPGVAHAELQRAIAKAIREHKHILLDFGGNWCGDCKVLDYYFQEPPNASLLAGNFVLVDINVGHFDSNTDLARKYNIPLHKGVPALAVLNSHGRLLYSQTGGQFEDMRHMSPDSVTAFLNMWKPTR